MGKLYSIVLLELCEHSITFGQYSNGGSCWHPLMNAVVKNQPHVAVSDLVTFLCILFTSNHLVSFTINDATCNVVNFLWPMLNS